MFSFISSNVQEGRTSPLNILRYMYLLYRAKWQFKSAWFYFLVRQGKSVDIPLKRSSGLSGTSSCGRWHVLELCCSSCDRIDVGLQDDTWVWNDLFPLSTKSGVTTRWHPFNTFPVFSDFTKVSQKIDKVLFFMFMWHQNQEKQNAEYDRVKI